MIRDRDPIFPLGGTHDDVFKRVKSLSDGCLVCSAGCSSSRILPKGALGDDSLL